MITLLGGCNGQTCLLVFVSVSGFVLCVSCVRFVPVTNTDLLYGYLNTEAVKNGVLFWVFLSDFFGFVFRVFCCCPGYFCVLHLVFKYPFG